MLDIPDMYHDLPAELGWAGMPGDRGNGVLRIKLPTGRFARAIASNQMGWEHVSVSIALDDEAIPTWEEMCYIKDLLWDKEDCVVQYHPPQSEYVNNHKGCLHLWRPTDERMPRPPLELVGVTGR